MLKIEKYVRKPFYVDAVEVTPTNMEEIAEWCEGVIETEKQGRRTVRYIKVPVIRPMSEKQTKAFVGDLVLKTDTGVKVYTAEAFKKCFIMTTDSPGWTDNQDELPLFEVINETTARQVCGKTSKTVDHKPCILDADHGKRPCTSIELKTPEGSPAIAKFPKGYPSPSTR